MFLRGFLWNPTCSSTGWVFCDVLRPLILSSSTSRRVTELKAAGSSSVLTRGVCVNLLTLHQCRNRWGPRVKKKLAIQIYLNMFMSELFLWLDCWPSSSSVHLKSDLSCFEFSCAAFCFLCFYPLIKVSLNGIRLVFVKVSFLNVSAVKLFVKCESCGLWLAVDDHVTLMRINPQSSSSTQTSGQQSYSLWSIRRRFSLAETQPKSFSSLSGLIWQIYPTKWIKKK